MQALFLGAELPTQERCFALYHAPRAPLRGSVLALYPFAEEMNKTRRMIGQGARALAACGYAVLQLDLRACGDSGGELSRTRWDDWMGDVRRACDWLADRHPAPPWLWGTRAGCLVAVEAARRMDRAFDYLFWQPQPSGQRVLQQFLRLKMAGQLQDGAAKGVTDTLHKELAAGHPVEIAGYRLSASLAQGLAAANLRPAPQGRRLHWLEVTPREPAQLLPASAATIDAWRSAGFDVAAGAVSGPSFWQTLDIEDAPALLDATVTALGGGTAQGPA